MRYFVVDAFADTLFSGNPAGVCLVDRPLDSTVMQQIAAENNLAETAFLSQRNNSEDYDLRWFTPEVEIDLCGHATLASAFILHRFFASNAKAFRFHTLSGILTVAPRDGLYEMDFPAWPAHPIAMAPQVQALGFHILEAHLSRDLLLLLESEAAVRDFQPDFAALAALPDCFGIIITAKGDTVDFVSRFFAPGAGIPEDPVTGSAHTTLIPFWAARLGKKQLIARQLSARGGTLFCEDRGERVKIAGRAALYLAGKIYI